MFEHRLLREHNYALLDPTGREAIPEDLATLPLLPSDMAEDSEHLLPRLIPLHPLSHDQRGALLDIMESLKSGVSPPLCALLDSEAESSRLALHLKEVQVLKSYRGTAVDKTWLRVHDPRVFIHLHRILPGEDHSGLFGPVSRWTIPFNGEWHSFARSDSGATSPYPRQRWPRARIADIGIINSVLSRLGVAHYRDAMAVSPDIETQIGRARTSHGLDDTEDLVEFASLTLSVARHFDQHPKIQPLIRDPQDGEGSRLADRLARVDRAVWQTLNV